MLDEDETEAVGLATMQLSKSIVCHWAKATNDTVEFTPHLRGNIDIKTASFSGSKLIDEHKW